MNKLFEKAVRLPAAIMVAAIAVLGMAVQGSALAQAYPTRPVTIIVAYAPGGANDIIARVFAQRLTEELGQSVIVENRTGASGIPGTGAVARAEPDGYTLLLGAGGTMTMNPGLFKSLPYDSLKSFVPVGLAAKSPLVLVVPPTLPVHNVAELIAYIKSKKDGVTFASPGAGTPLHLAGELFKKAAGVDMLHVPYKGSAPALNDVMAGRVDVMFDVAGSSMQFVNNGKLRALAVTSLQKSPVLPNVPTLNDQGLSGFDVTSWFGLFAPANTPAPIIAKLNAAMNKVAASPEMRDRLAPMGMEPAGGTSEQLRSLVERERTKWEKVIKDANLQPS
jgi:tripartite-type tricarboxylate transporter receptor subunit TctC